MGSEFVKRALRRGEEGKLWLESIPNIIAKYSQEWSLQTLSPFTLSYNYVAPAVREDGSHAVLKIGFPKDEEFQTEIAALSVFNGDGIVKLLEADRENAVILIERVEPGVPLSSMENDEEATKILAKVIKKIRKPIPSDHNFTTVAEGSRAISAVKQRSGGVTGQLPINLVNKAESLFVDLLASSESPVLVHGDLHHDNVLSSERDGWLAIDPKGIAAEPAYEVAAMIRNPYEKLKNISNLKPLLHRRIIVLSEELGIDPIRIHQWCLAQTVLSAVWNIEDVEEPKHALRVAEVLEKMKF